MELDLPPPVEAPETVEADELKKELLREIPEDRQQDIISMVVSDHNDALLDRSDWIDRLDADEKQYYGILPEKTFPWVGCANFAVPLTMLGVETLKPRLVASILGGEPPVFVRGIGAEDARTAETTELFLNWQLRTHMGLEDLVPESAHLFLMPGSVIAKTRWVVEQRRAKTVKSFPLDTDLSVIFQEIFGSNPPESLVSKSTDMDWEGEVSISGKAPSRVRLKLKFLEAEIQVLSEREITLYEGPRIELLQPQDFIFPARGGSDPQKLPWCTHRLWLSEHDLRRKVVQGTFNHAAVDELIRLRQPASTTPEDAEAAEETKDVMEGVSGDGSSNVRNEEFEVWEHYRRIDIDDDDYEEEVILWISPELPSRILGWDYLDNAVAHGRRPFRVGRYFPIPFRFLGLSFPEVVRGIQEEINAVHNQRIDMGTIRNSMTYFYRGSMTSPPSGRVRPGEGVPVDSVQDVLMAQWGGSEAIGQAEEALLYQYFERLTGLTDLALGRQPNRVGATRTATGVASLLSEAGLRFKTSMEAFQRFWVGVFEDVLALNQAYLLPEVEFRVTGRLPAVIQLKDRKDIAGKFDLRISATTETMNQAILRENATIRLQALMNPALVGAGLVGIKGLRKTLREFIRAHGEPDPDGIVEAASGTMVKTPEEELGIWVSGGDADPSPLENLAQHIEAHTAQMQDHVARMALGPPGLKKIEKHLAETTQLAQAQAVASMLQPGNGSPPVGRQGANAMTGAAAPQGVPSIQRGGGTPPMVQG